MRGLAVPATLTNTVFSHPAASDAQAFRFSESRHQTVTTKTNESAIGWWKESETLNSSNIIELIWHCDYTELVGTVQKNGITVHESKTLTRIKGAICADATAVNARDLKIEDAGLAVKDQQAADI